MRFTAVTALCVLAASSAVHAIPMKRSDTSMGSIAVSAPSSVQTAGPHNGFPIFRGPGPMAPPVSLIANSAMVVQKRDDIVDEIVNVLASLIEGLTGSSNSQKRDDFVDTLTSLIQTIIDSLGGADSKKRDDFLDTLTSLLEDFLQGLTGSESRKRDAFDDFVTVIKDALADLFSGSNSAKRDAPAVSSVSVVRPKFSATSIASSAISQSSATATSSSVASEASSTAAAPSDSGDDVLSDIVGFVVQFIEGLVSDDGSDDSTSSNSTVMSDKSDYKSGQKGTAKSMKQAMQSMKSMMHGNVTAHGDSMLQGSATTVSLAPAATQSGSGSLGVIQVGPNGTLTEQIIGLFPGLFNLSSAALQ